MKFSRQLTDCIEVDTSLKDRPGVAAGADLVMTPCSKTSDWISTYTEFEDQQVKLICHPIRKM